MKPEGEIIKSCPKCASHRIHRSHRRGQVERLLRLCGGQIRRCADCRFRYAWFWLCTIPLNKLDTPRGRLSATAVMSSGLLICIAVVWWMIRRFAVLEG